MTPDPQAERSAARLAFIEKRRHVLAGLVLDGVMQNLHGAQLALWCRTIMHRTDAMLGQMFDELIPPPKVELKATEADKKYAAENAKQPRKP